MAHKDKKTQYFHADLFVDKVLKRLGLENAHAEDMRHLRYTLGKRLRQEIVNTVLLSLEKDDLALLEKIQEDHAELSPLDALMMVMPQIDGLEEKLMARIDVVYGELCSYGDGLTKK